jgi:hypothetical protein
LSIFVAILLASNGLVSAQQSVDKLVPLQPKEQWQGWENLGGVTAGGPECVATQVNRLDCFARVAGGLLIRHQWNGAQWSGPVPINGIAMDSFFDSRPECVTVAPDHIDCFARRDSDQVMFQRTIHGGFMTGWHDLGVNPLSSEPDCVSVGGGRLDCFARAASASSNSAPAVLMHNSFDGNVWSGWVSRGGQILARTKPSCVVFRGEIHCIVVWSDGMLRHMQFQSPSSGPVVRNMPGGVLTEPAPGMGVSPKCMVTRGPDFNSPIDDAIHCFAPGLGLLLHETWNGQGNQTWTLSDVGGTFGGGDWDCLMRSELRIDCVELVKTRTSGSNTPNGFFMRHRTLETGQGVRISDVNLPTQGAIPTLMRCVSWAPDRIDCFAGGSNFDGSPLLHSWLVPTQPIFKKPGFIPRQ